MFSLCSHTQVTLAPIHMTLCGHLLKHCRTYTRKIQHISSIYTPTPWQSKYGCINHYHPMLRMSCPLSNRISMIMKRSTSGIWTQPPKLVFVAIHSYTLPIHGNMVPKFKKTNTNQCDLNVVPMYWLAPPSCCHIDIWEHSNCDPLTWHTLELLLLYQLYDVDYQFRRWPIVYV